MNRKCFNERQSGIMNFKIEKFQADLGWFEPKLVKMPSSDHPV